MKSAHFRSSFIYYMPYFRWRSITSFGNHLLVAIRRAVLHRSLPLATTHLSTKFSRVGSNVGVMGTISLALDYLFAIEDNLYSLL
ncbi:MAG TPA: hypothetical protein VFG81_16450 [Anaerolineales bacterium]|nr:hypothetical protein [Anaerolineales bacterium]